MEGGRVAPKKAPSAVCDWPLTQCRVSGLGRNHFPAPIEKRTSLNTEWSGDSPYAIMAREHTQTQVLGAFPKWKARALGRSPLARGEINKQCYLADVKLSIANPPHFAAPVDGMVIRRPGFSDGPQTDRIPPNAHVHLRCLGRNPEVQFGQQA